MSLEGFLWIKQSFPEKLVGSHYGRFVETINYSKCSVAFNYG